MITGEEILQELQRELNMRIGVYPLWITNGRIKQETAEHRIKCMQEAIRILKENMPAVGRNGQIGIDFSKK